MARINAPSRVGKILSIKLYLMASLHRYCMSSRTRRHAQGVIQIHAAVRPARPGCRCTGPADRAFRQRRDRPVGDCAGVGRNCLHDHRGARPHRAVGVEERRQPRPGFRRADHPLDPRGGSDAALCPRLLCQGSAEFRHVAVGQEQPVPVRLLVPGRRDRQGRRHAVQQYRSENARPRPARPRAFPCPRRRHGRFSLHQQADLRPRLEQMVDPADTPHHPAGRLLRRCRGGLARS